MRQREGRGVSGVAAEQLVGPQSGQEHPGRRRVAARVPVYALTARGKVEGVGDGEVHLRIMGVYQSRNSGSMRYSRAVGNVDLDAS